MSLVCSSILSRLVFCFIVQDGLLWHDLRLLLGFLFCQLIL